MHINPTEAKVLSATVPQPSELRGLEFVGLFLHFRLSYLVRSRDGPKSGGTGEGFPSGLILGWWRNQG